MDWEKGCHMKTSEENKKQAQLERALEQRCWTGFHTNDCVMLCKPDLLIITRQ